MTSKFLDAVEVLNTRTTEDGYLVATARSARVGIQTYAGWEVGRPDLETVNVYRPPEEVFSKDSLQGFSHTPVVVDHPDEDVTADNWGDYAVGEVSTAAMREGQWITLPLIVKDAKAIEAVQSGKRELSAGYKCELEWSDGVTPDGQPYQAIQKNIRINHLAIVSKARAGAKARIPDAADGGKDRKKWGAFPLDSRRSSAVTEKTTQITRDGLPVTVPEAASPIINKWLGDADKKLADSDARIAELEKQLAERDAQIDDMKKNVKTADEMDAAVQARADLIDRAKRVAPKLETKGMSDADIRKAAVTEVRGADAVAGKSEAYIDAAFDLLQESMKDGKSNPLSKAIADAKSTNDGDPQAVRDGAYQAYLKGLRGETTTQGNA